MDWHITRERGKKINTGIFYRMLKQMRGGAFISKQTLY